MKSLILLLLIIAVTSVALRVKNQIDRKDVMNAVSCSMTFSYFTLCPTSIRGNMTFIEPYINDCHTMFIDMHMNLSYATDSHYFHHYRGTITADCGNDRSNYIIIGHAYFDEKQFNGTASMCNDDCLDLYFDGKYELDSGNATCHSIITKGLIC